MGQSRSGLSHSSTASRRATWRADETSSRLRIRRFRVKKKPPSEQLNKNPMKNKVLSCLGRRKRNSSQTEGDSGCGNAATDPATIRGHRVGKLPRDEGVSAAGGHQAELGCLGTPSGLGDYEAVNATRAPGVSDAPGLETRSGDVSSAGGDQPRSAEENNDSDPPPRAMEDQPLGGHRQDSIVSDVGVLTGTNLSLVPLLPSDPDTERTLSSLHSDKRLDVDCGLSITGGLIEAKMTKTDSTATACSPTSIGEQKTCCPTQTDQRKDSDKSHKGPPGAQSFPGTIPKLIITRDPSPSRPQDPPALLTAPLESSNGSCLELHPDEESPCSDSGCGGSPALIRCSRKLSNSSSIGLSSASSFEESEDDFASSDIESSLSLCSPDDGTGVGAFTIKIKQMAVII